MKKYQLFNGLILLMLFSFNSCMGQSKKAGLEIKISLDKDKEINITPNCKERYLIELDNIRNENNIPYKINLEEYNEDCTQQSNLSFLLESKNDSMYILNISQFTVRHPIVDEIYFIKKNNHYTPKYMRQTGISGSMVYYSPYKSSSLISDTINLLSNYRLEEKKEGLELYTYGKIEGRIISGKRIDLAEVFNLDNEVMDYRYTYNCIYESGELMKKERYKGIYVFIAEEGFLGENFTCKLTDDDYYSYEYKAKVVTENEWNNYVDSIDAFIYKGF